MSAFSEAVYLEAAYTASALKVHSRQEWFEYALSVLADAIVGKR